MIKISQNCLRYFIYHITLFSAYRKNGIGDPYVGPRTLHLGPFTWDPSPRTREPEPVGGTWDLYIGSRTWDPSLVTRDLEPGTLYVGNGTQYLYVERGTHT